jgi:predicted membrane channel-forming protein YqfA (hemolysin III family)
MFRMYAMYRPLRFFFYISALLSVLGAVPVIRFLVRYFSGDGAGNIQSLVIGGVLLIAGFVFFVTGLLSDLISQNRQLTELSLTKIRELELHFLEEKRFNNSVAETDRD